MLPFVLGVTTLIILLLAFFSYMNNSDAQRTTDIVANTLLSNIKNSLVIGDELTIQSLISSVGKENFSYIEVKNLKGKTISKYSPHGLNMKAEGELKTYEILNETGQRLGSLTLEKPKFAANNFILFVLIIFSIIILLIANLIVFRRFKKIISDVTEGLSSSSSTPFFAEVNNAKIKIDSSTKLLVEKERMSSRLGIAKQIAHDIRSPLEALKSIVGELDELDFSTKQIITNSVGRISDIANGLLKSGAGEQKEFAEGSFRILMDDLIGDKQFEYDRKIHFTAAIDYKNSYMLGNENALYRGISNIINNAVEASGENDKIDVRLCEGTLGILLTIKDHGQGMTQDFIEKALAGGVTTKDKGNGLGLSFAKKTVEEHKGLFKVESEVGKGTTISIDLPKIPTPNWFTDEIMINEAAELIVCVDDDPSFLQLYKDKLHGFNVKTFSEKKIEEALAQAGAQFYFDYDLGQSYSGLDYIIDKGLAARATLVTSMHQDQQIQKRCEQFGIKILPKQVFNNAHIKSVAKTQTSHSKTFHILIDDDELMHMSWKMEAQKQGLSFKAYFTVEEFLNSAAQICKSSVIYIDSNLADGIKGEVESEKISKIGFSEIYLATGYAASDIQKPKWIKEVVGKRAQFK